MPLLTELDGREERFAINMALLRELWDGPDGAFA